MFLAAYMERQLVVVRETTTDGASCPKCRSEGAEEVTLVISKSGSCYPAADKALFLLESRRKLYSISTRYAASTGILGLGRPIYIVPGGLDPLQIYTISNTLIYIQTSSIAL